MISGDIKGSLDRVVNQMDEAEPRVQALLLQYSIALQNLLKTNLESALGSKYSHLAVEVSGTGGRMTTISVTSKDDIGGYILTGTKPHVIRSTIPMPIAGGQYRYVVHHPGTKGVLEEIESILVKTELQAQTLLGGFGNRILA